MNNQYDGIFSQLDLMFVALGSECTKEQAETVLQWAKRRLPCEYWAGIALHLDDLCGGADLYYHTSENLAEHGYHY